MNIPHKTPPTLTSFCNRWQIFVFHQCWEIGRPDSGSLFPNKEVKLRANHNDICVSGLALPGTRLLSLQFSTCPPSFTFHLVTEVVNTTASSNSRLAFPPPLWLTRMDGGRSGKSSDENSGTALTPPPLINVTRAVVFQSSHSNFIAEYQQSGWSLSKHFWACAKLPSITDPSLIPKHLGNHFLFLEMSLQGYLVVFQRNLFSAVNRTLTTCVCQPADLDLARLSLMVQGHIKNEIDKAQENCTSLNWSHILFKP